ncbi:ATPase subunit of ABC transporter with duplicated ATPase domains [Actinoplanes lutulentus]|uniref:ATPase subunit of ABC transporter with duplicated ATPase domains n=1 Tax=Actinoplanes lutulentus TaxID=1287878 RepID=A0A327ZLF3_9ACTN|nr:ABC-F family ATP-binding cassette domain-containing protein [Actinoplanes lutulentus]MBB2940836.1 ATPase subunit of ABC transporter with duplicated ATPase domains [Actinoplanes lutulentus]RAK43145.1 ATPase subunit of ABC transporter with duplicated ATPase domains [Actinoplanes lutulentus]
MSDAFVVCSTLSFSWPDDTPVFQDLSFSVPGGRTGLVAANGAGKSTLLKLITGDLRPASGSVSVRGVLGYLPQHLPFVSDQSVAQVLGVDRILAALHAIEGGDAAEEHFATVGNDWDVEERSRAELDRLGLGDVGLDRTLGTLSGGQVVSLGLAAQLLKRPDVLLLDEPTNNLDRPARDRLVAVLRSWGGCLLLVSHDRELLDEVDRIAALDAGEIRWYGGTYSEYEEALRGEREVAEREVRNASQDLKRQKRELQQARERSARRASTASRNLADAGLARIVAGGLKRDAQVSAAKANDVHTSRVADAQARLDAAGWAARQDDRIVVELPGTHVPAGRTVFSGAGLRASFDSSLFATGGLDLHIRGPERIALTGPNGAGKSTLLRLISGSERTAYLSQRLDLLDEDRSVAENLAAFAPNLPDAERMNLLARFLFRGGRAHLPVRALSGGERLRATLACVLYAEPAPQLLLLDEPTNNLDLASAGQLEAALIAYQGAFVVVSHDERFLREIGVDRWLRLEDGSLSEVRPV